MKTCTSKGSNTKLIKANPNTYGYQRAKKYPILISLFCLCYALGTQEIKTADHNPSSCKLTYDFSGSEVSYKIDGKPVSILYSHDVNDIVLFGKPGQAEQQHISIAYCSSFSQTKKKGDIPVTKYKLTKPFTLRGNNATLSAASASDIFWRKSFTFRQQEANLAFCYRRSRSQHEVDEFIELDQPPSSCPLDDVAQRTSNKEDSTKPTKEKHKTNIQATNLTVYPHTTVHIVKKKVVQATYTYKLDHSSTARMPVPNSHHTRPYIKLNYGIIITVVIVILYAIFYKPINKKAMRFIEQYILRER